MPSPHHDVGEPANVRNLSAATVHRERPSQTRGTSEIPSSASISVIVPVRNGRSYVEDLVAALDRQTVPKDDFELVLGDDGSTDGTLEWLARRSLPWIRVAAGSPRNSYAARNRAVSHASGAILAFCDIDCVPEPDWLEQGRAALGGADVVAGRVRFVLPERRTVWTLLDIDSSKDHEREVRNSTAETANLILRRSLFDEIGGFEDSVPEFGDFDFVQRAVAHGASLAFAPDVIVWHPTRDRGTAFLRSHWLYSRGYGEREGRAGRLPADIRPKSLVPIVPVWRTRRWWGRSLGPDRHWLAENGVVPTAMENLLALPLLYVVLPYLRASAQFIGWLGGRRLRAR